MRALRIAVLVVAGELTAMFVYVVVARIRYPFELEWMCGSVLDHVERVRAGLPVYTAPSTRWIPFLYPPLFYWLTAPLGGGFFTCRLVSLVAALVQAACIWRLARVANASRYWATVGVLLFFACFFYVGNWYDLERSDTLCMALVLVAALLSVERPSVAGAIGAGSLLGIAFFAKQQALPFGVAATAALAIHHAWKRAVALGVTVALVVLIGTLLENRATGGWFGYYVLEMPAAHGIDIRLWKDVWDYDLPHGIFLVAATFAFCTTAARRAVTGDRRDVFLATMVAAGALTALSSRLHIGGWINVLQFWTSLACPSIAVLGARTETWLAGRPFAMAGDALGSALLLAQLALWIQSPAERVPDVLMRPDTERFLLNVRRLERKGEVLVVGHGHMTKTPHFQMSALADVNRMSGPPADLLDALRDRRLAAIVDDARAEDAPPLGLWPPIMLEDIPALRALLFADYFVAEDLGDDALRLAMPAPAEPRWAYRPRRVPLSLPDSELRRLHFAEMKLATRRSEAVRSGDSPPFDPTDIEELAARAISATP